MQVQLRVVFYPFFWLENLCYTHKKQYLIGHMLTLTFIRSNQIRNVVVLAT
jgi:hypothetical protein